MALAGTQQEPKIVNSSLRDGTSRNPAGTQQEPKIVVFGMALAGTQQEPKIVVFGMALAGTQQEPKIVNSSLRDGTSRNPAGT